MAAKNQNFDELSRKCCDPRLLRMIPSVAVKQKCYDEDPEYGASWDLYVTKGGRVFFPVCAELLYPKIVRLYEYLPDEDRLELHFKLEDVTIQQERAIRTSKIHTSITELPDGRLIMTTHTTARSPQHPDWMPQAYHGHPWEGYQGSHILIYDYVNKKVEDRGIPVPFESIYGAKYDAGHNCLYFTGYLLGHLYRYDLDTNRVTDYGKVTEYGSYRICEGPDGHFYSSSRSGEIFRINLDTQQIEMLGVQILDNNAEMSAYHRVLFFSVAINGKLYYQSAFSMGLQSYDPATGEVAYEGDLRPVNLGGYRPRTAPGCYDENCYGMALDEQNCLWYTYRIGGLHLVRWDFLHGGKPESMGLLGLPEHVPTSAAELIFQNKKLYIGDTNHGADGPGVTVVDLEKLMEIRNKEAETGECSEIRLCKDAFIYLVLARLLDTSVFPFEPGEDCKKLPMRDFYPGEDFERDLRIYIEQDRQSENYYKVMAENPVCVQGTDSKDIKAILLWRELSVELSQVHALYWTNDRTLIAQVGSPDGEKLELTIVDGEITQKCPISHFRTQKIPDALKGLAYPYYPGRQYKAVPTAWAPWKDGSCLVGTLDGMLAIARKDGSVYSLGTAVQCGAVHHIVTDADAEVAYGVAGDPMNMGNVFSYDDISGLRWLGTVFRDDKTKGLTLSGDQLYRVALSPDKSCLVIGTVDRMGCLFFVKLK